MRPLAMVMTVCAAWPEKLALPLNSCKRPYGVRQRAAAHPFAAAGRRVTIASSQDYDAIAPNPVPHASRRSHAGSGTRLPGRRVGQSNDLASNSVGVDVGVRLRDVREALGGGGREAEAAIADAVEEPLQDVGREIG